MPIVIMSGLLILVIAASVGVYFLFTRRLQRIEDELWGEKRREAEAAALESEEHQSSEGDTSDATLE